MVHLTIRTNDFFTISSIPNNECNVSGLSEAVGYITVTAKHENLLCLSVIKRPCLCCRSCEEFVEILERIKHCINS